MIPDRFTEEDLDWAAEEMRVEDESYEMRLVRKLHEREARKLKLTHLRELMWMRMKMRKG